MKTNRREWLQKSLLGSAALLTSTINYADSPILKQVDSDFLRLHWNENPFGPPRSVIEQVKIAASECNLYWDEVLVELAEELGKRHSLTKDNFYITSGSTEILTLLGQQIGLVKGEILTPWPSFPTMMIFGERCGATIKQVALSDNKINLDKLKDGISDKTNLIFICNPNNPTSTELNSEDLRSFIKAVSDDILIVVDEAYIEFSKLGKEGSVVNKVKDHQNLIVCRTFSKAYGCAGFRIGYAVSQDRNIKSLTERHPSLGMSPGLLPAKAALAALEDAAFVKYTVEQTNLGKDIVYEAFDKWGVGYENSSTNFIYAREDRFIPAFISKMRENKIMLSKWPIMKDHFRISIGKSEWMKSFVANAENYLV